MKTRFAVLMLTTFFFSSISHSISNSPNKKQRTNPINNTVKPDKIKPVPVKPDPVNFGKIEMSVPLTDLQKVMLTKPISSNNLTPQQLAEKYRLVRLWPFNKYENLADDLILGKSLINNNFRVEPFYCGNDVYAKFNGPAMIQSDESYFLDQYFAENKPSELDATTHKINKGLSKLSEWFPNYLPAMSAEEKNLVDTKLYKKYKSKLQYSSSMIGVESSQDTTQLKDTDYTVGGWFKPQRFIESDHSNSKMTLITKKFTNLSGTKVVKEWEVFTSGNVIYFHNYRDNSQPVAIKYLNTEQAHLFRYENANYYGQYDYYNDVMERLTSPQHIDKSFLPTSQNNLAPILPNEKSAVNKPIPIVPPPMLNPVITPETPNLDIPKPLPPVVIVKPSTGKEYTSNIDLKRFWHATVLGQCYNCIESNKHSDVWHYISFSVHLNDPLGPYVDFWIIMDPNPDYFKSKATFLKHAKHLRWELNRQILSQPVLNPFKNGIDIERDCSKTSPAEFQKGSCLKSVLEIGSIDPEKGYSGYMRGIYIAKKAFSEKEVLELAAEYYPDDNSNKNYCTYKKLPR